MFIFFGRVDRMTISVIRKKEVVIMASSLSDTFYPRLLSQRTFKNLDIPRDDIVLFSISLLESPHVSTLSHMLY